MVNSPSSMVGSFRFLVAVKAMWYIWICWGVFRRQWHLSEAGLLRFYLRREVIMLSVSERMCTHIPNSWLFRSQKIPQNNPRLVIANPYSWNTPKDVGRITKRRASSKRIGPILVGNPWEVCLPRWACLGVRRYRGVVNHHEKMAVFREIMISAKLQSLGTHKLNFYGL